MIARKAAFAQLCAIEADMDLIAFLKDTEPDMSNLAALVGPLVEFFDRGRSVAPAELAPLLRIIDPVAAELLTVLNDYDEHGIEVGSETWANGVLTVIVANPDFLESVGGAVGAVEEVCLS